MSIRSEWVGMGAVVFKFRCLVLTKPVGIYWRLVMRWLRVQALGVVLVAVFAGGAPAQVPVPAEKWNLSDDDNRVIALCVLRVREVYARSGSANQFDVSIGPDGVLRYSGTPAETRLFTECMRQRGKPD